MSVRVKPLDTVCEGVSLVDSEPEADGVLVTLGEREDVPVVDGDNDKLAVVDNDGVPVALAVEDVLGDALFEGESVEESV